MTEKEHYLRAVERDELTDATDEEPQFDLAPGVPDVRVSLDEAIALWDKGADACVDIEITSIEPRILEKLIEEIWDGIGERGACAQINSSTIRALYKVPDMSQEQQDAIEAYAKALLRFLNLPDSALIAFGLVTGPYRKADREAIDGLYGGPTAVSDS